MSPTYLIKGDLTEKQIEADVAMYLGWCAEGTPFRLHDVNEQLTGADKLSDVALPIYIQFKKSSGLHSLAKQPIKPRVNESPLQSIRQFRAQQELPDDPTLFFELRKLAKHADDLQHNILFRHNLPPASHAIYVAPLYLDREKFFDSLCRGPRYFDDPWIWRKRQFLHGVQSSALFSHFDRQPFLKGCISIPPHELVQDHSHYYAYSIAGDAVSWHSPEIVEPGVSRLSDFLSLRVRQLLAPEFDLISAEQCLGVAEDIFQAMDGEVGDVFGKGTPVEKLQSYGRWLLKEHAIRQILFLSRREDLEKLRAIRR